MRQPNRLMALSDTRGNNLPPPADALQFRIVSPCTRVAASSPFTLLMKRKKAIGGERKNQPGARHEYAPTCSDFTGPRPNPSTIPTAAERTAYVRPGPGTVPLRPTQSIKVTSGPVPFSTIGTVPDKISPALPAPLYTARTQQGDRRSRKKDIYLT